MMVEAHAGRRGSCLWQEEFHCLSPELNHPRNECIHVPISAINPFSKCHLMIIACVCVWSQKIIGILALSQSFYSQSDYFGVVSLCISSI